VSKIVPKIFSGDWVSYLKPSGRFVYRELVKHTARQDLDNFIAYEQSSGLAQKSGKNNGNGKVHFIKVRARVIYWLL
jgi:hypothetical protein